MPVEIERVLVDGDIECVAALATEIWTQHFTQIIGEGQVEYMLEKFQSSVAIKSQITSGAQYYLANIENESVGYVGLVPDCENNKIMLSKIYVKKLTRGKGVGKAILDFVEGRCVANGISTVWLTVNRLNDGPVAWYKRHGFLVIDEVKNDIGGGFFMDDYIMEKRT